jgi:hypothetical protein
MNTAEMYVALREGHIVICTHCPCRGLALSDVGRVFRMIDGILYFSRKQGSWNRIDYGVLPRAWDDHLWTTLEVGDISPKAPRLTLWDVVLHTDQENL